MGFLRIEVEKTYTLSYCRVSKLQHIIQDEYKHKEHKSDFSEAKKRAKNQGKMLNWRRYHLFWAQLHDPKILEDIISRYRMVYMPEQTRRYAYEIYRLMGEGAIDRYPVSLPLEKDDRENLFVKQNDNFLTFPLTENDVYVSALTNDAKE